MALLEGPTTGSPSPTTPSTTSSAGAGWSASRCSRRFPEFDQQGVDEILDGVTRSGEPFVGHGMALRVARADGTSEEVLVDLVFQPLPPSEDQPAGVFIQGNNVTRGPPQRRAPHRAQQGARAGDQRCAAGDHADRADPDRRIDLANRGSRLDPAPRSGRQASAQGRRPEPSAGLQRGHRRRGDRRLRGIVRNCGLSRRCGVRFRHRERSFVGRLPRARAVPRPSRLLVDPDPHAWPQGARHLRHVPPRAARADGRAT